MKPYRDLTTDQIERLLGLMNEIEKPLYVFMDEQESVLDSVNLDSNEQALAYARSLDCPVVNVLRWVATADNNQEDYQVIEP